MVQLLDQDISKKQLKKAGKTMRDFWSRADEVGTEVAIAEADGPGLVDAMHLVRAYRAYHARPLARVNANLRYYIKQSGMGTPQVTQRLKRFSTMIDKLCRLPRMALPTMEDIGGVRAVLENQQQVCTVRDALRRQKRWDIHRERDYTDGGDPGPKEDGYRAIHVVVRKDGCFVEIQLRTPRQDNWAQSVEKDTRRLKSGLKFGSGPDDLRQYYRLVAELFSTHDRNVEPEEGFMEDLAKQYRAVRKYYPDAPDHL